MFLGIFLFLRRGKKIIFHIIVDHRLGENRIFFVTLCGIKFPFHKGDDLIHVQIDIRQGFQLCMVNAGETFQYAVKQIVCVDRHGCCLQS